MPYLRREKSELCAISDRKKERIPIEYYADIAYFLMVANSGGVDTWYLPGGISIRRIPDKERNRYIAYPNGMVGNC